MLGPPRHNDPAAGARAAYAAHLGTRTYHRLVLGGISESISNSVYNCEVAALRRPPLTRLSLSYFLTLHRPCLLAPLRKSVWWRGGSESMASA
eukprot:SAG31_NODE_2451_length_5667_cov_5.877694_3_plen_93_part_00